jgi:hypothetical protein
MGSARILLAPFGILPDGFFHDFAFRLAWSSAEGSPGQIRLEMEGGQ